MNNSKMQTSKFDSSELPRPHLENTAEKVCQVWHMAIIYANARFTVVCISVGQELKHLKALMKGFELAIHLYALDGLLALATSPHFQLLWIMQETYYSNKIVLLWAGNRIFW